MNKCNIISFVFIFYKISIILLFCITICMNIYNDIIIKDVMTKKKTQDEAMLKSVANYAMDNVGNLVSANNIENTMNNDGREINVRTVERYLDGFVESFFLYKASRYDIKGKQYLKTGEKYYVSDL